MASTETLLQEKTTSELVKEISLLEREIFYLESHLLSLYRSAFENYFVSSPFIANSASKNPSSYYRSSTMQEANNRSQYVATPPVEADLTNEELNLPHVNVSGEEISYHRSLADHLGTTIQDHIPETTCKISEDIIRCISAVYCKLTSSTNQKIKLLTSSSSSCTSSSILSPEDLSHSWSPQFWCEDTSSPYQIKLPRQKKDPYKDMIEVPKICIDDGRFEFASKMLKIFRSLIGRLEAVDPRKTEQHEQLAFWINIHNALMMHAFLAYGLRQNQIRNTSSILKAAYNIGGHSVNIYIIQHLILGRCHPHYPSSHFSPLLASARKFRKVNSKHPFALDHPQPHAYFALCMGASTDPAVRIYTTKGVHHELKLAKREYIQAKVSIQNGKIILPKLLYYYAKDASIELPSLIEIVSCSMQADEQRAIQQCFQRKGRKSVKLSPFKTDFRFLVHKDLTK